MNKQFSCHSPLRALEVHWWAIILVGERTEWLVTVRMELPGGQAAVLVCRRGMIDNTSQPTYPPLLHPQRINLIFPTSMFGWRWEESR